LAGLFQADCGANRADKRCLASKIARTDIRPVKSIFLAGTLISGALGCALGEAESDAPRGAATVAIQIDPIRDVDELQILDWLIYHKESEILAAIGGGKVIPETPISRLRLTHRKIVWLEKRQHVACVFESSRFVNPGDGSPVVVALFATDYKLVSWTQFRAHGAMEAALVRYFFPKTGGAPVHGDRAELVLVRQHWRSLTGALLFNRLSLSSKEIVFLGESNEWKANIDDQRTE
jgi:hypothetical protein